MIVKEVKEVEQKSIQEVESALIEKKEQIESGKMDSSEAIVADTTEDSDKSQPELQEDDILYFIKSKYNKELTSIDQLFQEREEAPAIPEDVSAYLEYKNKTGRGFEDYVKLNRDFDAIDENQLLKEYFLSTEEALDSDDVGFMLEEFNYDEELDEEIDIKKKRLAKKKAIAKAKNYFNEQKEIYNQPHESMSDGISEEEKKELEEYKQYISSAKNNEEELKKKREWFIKQTDDVFSDFKGFDFNIGDTKVVFKPGSAEDLKRMNLDSTNFIKKFMGDDGLIKDAVGYHKALSIAMDPDRFAKHFYDQGASDATDGVTRKIKNIDMTERGSSQVVQKDGVKIRAVSSDSGRGLKIKSKK